MTARRSKLLPLLSMLLLVGASFHLSPVGASPVDSDHDGIYDAVEGTVDTDADGRPDYLHIDNTAMPASAVAETIVEWFALPRAAPPGAAAAR